MADFATLRRMMVDGQIRPSDVTDRSLLDALLEIPREHFAQGEMALAYLDLDLPVGGDRRLLKPMILAKMVQALELTADDKVLDVGCVTGYGAALMSKLVGQVIALEHDAALLAKAERALIATGTSNVRFVQGNLVEGCKAESPYTAILVEGCIEIEPTALCAQLADGGRLVCIQGAGPAAKALLYTRNGDEISRRALFDATAAALPGFARPKTFVF